MKRFSSIFINTSRPESTATCAVQRVSMLLQLPRPVQGSELYGGQLMGSACAHATHPLLVAAFPAVAQSLSVSTSHSRITHADQSCVSLLLLLHNRFAFASINPILRSHILLPLFVGLAVLAYCRPCFSHLLPWCPRNQNAVRLELYFPARHLRSSDRRSHVSRNL